MPQFSPVVHLPLLSHDERLTQAFAEKGFQLLTPIRSCHHDKKSVAVILATTGYVGLSLNDCFEDLYHNLTELTQDYDQIIAYLTVPALMVIPVSTSIYTQLRAQYHTFFKDSEQTALANLKTFIAEADGAYDEFSIFTQAIKSDQAHLSDQLMINYLTQFTPIVGVPVDQNYTKIAQMITDEDRAEIERDPSKLAMSHFYERYTALVTPVSFLYSTISTLSPDKQLTDLEKSTHTTMINYIFAQLESLNNTITPKLQTTHTLIMKCDSPSPFVIYEFVDLHSDNSL